MGVSENKVYRTPKSCHRILHISRHFPVNLQQGHVGFQPGSAWPPALLLPGRDLDSFIWMCLRKFEHGIYRLIYFQHYFFPMISMINMIDHEILMDHIFRQTHSAVWQFLGRLEEG